MSEMLDYYDKEMCFIGSQTREIVHERGLWHKTVHCWLYDKSCQVYFQIRKDVGKLYTTASGHVQSGESIDDALRREVFEETGLQIDVANKELLAIDSWRMCSEKCGVKKQDNVFANVFMCEIDNRELNFHFDEIEVSGVVAVNAMDALNLFLNKNDKINGVLFDNNGIHDMVLTSDNFLLCPGEIAVLKYGRQMKFVCDKILRHQI